MTDIETRHKRIVAATLKNLRTDPNTQSIFMLWPNLIQITERFCNFVSPLMPARNGDSLVNYAINQAIIAYRKETVEGLKPRAYVNGILESATAAIDGLTVQGVHKDYVVTWEPFIEPMLIWMIRNNVLTIKTTGSSNNPAKTKLARMSLMTHIVAAQDAEAMNLITKNTPL